VKRLQLLLFSKAKQTYSLDFFEYEKARSDGLRWSRYYF